MIEKGLYYADENYYQLIRNIGGEWSDKKHRPIVCLIKANNSDNIYWAVPMGKLNHRDNKQITRINTYMNYPTRDIRSCFYHIGRTTTQSIFFISDVIPISDKYIKETHLGADNNHFIIKNKKLISDLERKLKRILKYESQNPNFFRQHITDVEKYLLNENKSKALQTV